MEHAYTHSNKEVRFGRVEKDQLYGTFDLFEWSLGMSPRKLVNPDTTLAFTARCPRTNQKFHLGHDGCGTHRL